MNNLQWPVILWLLQLFDAHLTRMAKCQKHQGSKRSKTNKASWKDSITAHDIRPTGRTLCEFNPLYLALTEGKGMRNEVGNTLTAKQANICIYDCARLLRNGNICHVDLFAVIVKSKNTCVKNSCLRFRKFSICFSFLLFKWSLQ